jgi:hypothetical protein
MLDFIILEAPLFYPNKCATCGNYKGPVIDSHIETTSRERIYVCQRCVGRMAQKFGLTAGDEQDRLLRSDALLRERDRELVKVNERVAKLTGEKRELRAQVSELQEHRTWANGRIGQLEAAIGEDTRSSTARSWWSTDAVQVDGAGPQVPR